MTTEDLLRQALNEQAASVAPLDRLVTTALATGRRRRTTARVAAACGAVAVVATGTTGALALAGHAGTAPSRPSSFATATLTSTPWWRSWPAGRHYGPVDHRFLTAVAATSRGVSVYASGTTADGTDFALYLDRPDGHTPQWVQGWDGAPDFAQGAPVPPTATWMSFTSPTAATHHGDGSTNQQWLVLVGRPGTTHIDYSPDGVRWTPVPVQQGIGVLLLRGGFPPSTARVRLGDAGGVYATGVPAGAGAADPTPSAAP